MSHPPTDQSASSLSDITFRLHAGAVLSVEELERFRAAAEAHQESPAERMIRLIREDNAKQEAAA